MQVHTDRTISTNETGIIIRDNKEKTCMLMDIAVLSDLSSPVKVAEKLSKYNKDLEIE